jgi:hypothetical protein
VSRLDQFLLSTVCVKRDALRPGGEQRAKGGIVMNEQNVRMSFAEWFWDGGVYYLSRALALHGLTGALILLGALA